MPTIEELQEFGIHKKYASPKYKPIKKVKTNKGQLKYWGELLFEGDYKLIQTKKNEYIMQGYNPKGFKIVSV